MVRGNASTQARTIGTKDFIQHSRAFSGGAGARIQRKVHDVAAGCFWCTFEERRIREPGSKIYGLEASRPRLRTRRHQWSLWYVSFEQRAVQRQFREAGAGGSDGSSALCTWGVPGQGAGLEGLVGGKARPQRGARHAIRPGLREGVSGHCARTRRHQCGWRAGRGASGARLTLWGHATC